MRWERKKQDFKRERKKISCTYAEIEFCCFVGQHDRDRFWNKRRFEYAVSFMRNCHLCTVLSCMQHQGLTTYSYPTVYGWNDNKTRSEKVWSWFQGFGFVFSSFNQLVEHRINVLSQHLVYHTDHQVPSQKPEASNKPYSRLGLGALLLKVTRFELVKIMGT